MQRKTSARLQGGSHQLRLTSAPPTSSYWGLDAPSDGVEPVSSSRGGVGLEEELTSCLCCDLQIKVAAGVDQSWRTRSWRYVAQRPAARVS